MKIYQIKECPLNRQLEGVYLHSVDTGLSTPHYSLACRNTLLTVLRHQIPYYCARLGLGFSLTTVIEEVVL
jgi:hypothetical protein